MHFRLIVEDISKKNTFNLFYLLFRLERLVAVNIIIIITQLSTWSFGHPLSALGRKSESRQRVWNTGLVTRSEGRRVSRGALESWKGMVDLQMPRDELVPQRFDSQDKAWPQTPARLVTNVLVNTTWSCHAKSGMQSRSFVRFLGSP